MLMAQIDSVREFPHPAAAIAYYLTTERFTRLAPRPHCAGTRLAGYTADYSSAGPAKCRIGRVARFVHDDVFALSPRGARLMPPGEPGPINMNRREWDMIQRLRRFLTDDSGQDLVEYALLLVLLTIVVIGALQLLGPTIGEFFNEVSSNLNDV
jgi:Flp pilus assembly pilin Flp